MFPLISLQAEGSMIQFLGLPGDSGYPRLVAIDSQNAQLLFIHFYKKQDTIRIASLQRALTADTWTNVTSFSIPPLGSSRVVRPSFSLSANFYIVYYHPTNTIQLKSYVASTWSSSMTLFTEEELRGYGTGPIENIQAVVDSNNHLHLVWERRFSNKEIMVEKRSLYYSKFDGEKTSIPERIDVVEYDTFYCPSFEGCPQPFLAIDPADRLYLAWIVGPTFFTTRTQGGWMEPIRVDTSPYSTNITIQEETNLTQADLPLLDFQIDSRGALYFFYSVVPENGRLLLVKYQDGAFVQFDSDQLAHLHPFSYRDLPMKLFDVERDFMDRFHLVFIMIDAYAMGSSHLSYQTFKDGFSAPVMVSEFGGSEVDLSIDTENTPHIVWRQKVGREEIFYTRLTEAGWQEPTQVTNRTEIDQAFGWYNPPVTTVPERALTSVAVIVVANTIFVILYAQDKKKRK